MEGHKSRKINAFGIKFDNFLSPALIISNETSPYKVCIILLYFERGTLFSNTTLFAAAVLASFYDSLGEAYMRGFNS